MHIRIQNQKKLKFTLNKILFILAVCILFITEAKAQCLSAMNPVGGAENLLSLEKNSLRSIVFYKGGISNAYFSGSKKSDYNQIDRANYNFLSLTLGYGLSQKITFELETGYFINKTQVYNTTPEISLTGRGFSNFNLLLKYNLYADLSKRIYFSGAAGLKMPASRNYQSVDNVELPYQLQPSQGSYGLIVKSSFVKENSLRGLRYFVTNRVEINGENPYRYKPGSSVFTSLYVSKHLMFPWLKGDWTVILQLRNELRFKDVFKGETNQSTGSCLFFAVPQVNYVINEKWNISAMADLPVYRYFNGTQLASALNVSLVLSRTFGLWK